MHKVYNATKSPGWIRYCTQRFVMIDEDIFLHHFGHLDLFQGPSLPWLHHRHHHYDYHQVVSYPTNFILKLHLIHHLLSKLNDNDIFRYLFIYLFLYLFIRLRQVVKLLK